MSKRRRKTDNPARVTNPGTLIDPFQIFVQGVAAFLRMPADPRPAAPAVPEWYCSRCAIDLKIPTGTAGDVPYCPKCRGAMIIKPTGRSVEYGPRIIETTAEDVTHRRLPEGRKKNE
jgi:hypothetical protein